MDNRRDNDMKKGFLNLNTIFSKDCSKEKDNDKVKANSNVTENDKDATVKNDADIKININFPEKQDVKETVDKTQEFTYLANKPVEKTKLTIIFIENTNLMQHSEAIIKKIVNSLTTNGEVIFINYGRTVKKSKLFNVNLLNEHKVFCRDILEQEAVFYDALKLLEDTMKDNYFKVIELPTKKIRIDKIECIAFGRGIDTGSKTSKIEAIDICDEMFGKFNVSSKYFCLTEASFLEVAELGFRSIGSISR